MSLTFTPTPNRHPRSTTPQLPPLTLDDARDVLLDVEAATRDQLDERCLRNVARRLHPFAPQVATTDPRRRLSVAVLAVHVGLISLAECVEPERTTRRAGHWEAWQSTRDRAGRILARIDQDLAEALAAVEALEILAGTTPTPAVPPSPEVIP